MGGTFFECPGLPDHLPGGVGPRRGADTLPAEYRLTTHVFETGTADQRPVGFGRLGAHVEHSLTQRHYGINVFVLYIASMPPRYPFD